MNKYQVDDLTKGVFAETITIEAKSPKEAAEKATSAKVKRDYFGNIVVYATYVSPRNGQEVVKGFVYEVEKSADN